MIAALTIPGEPAGLGLTLMCLAAFALGARRWSPWWLLAGALACVPTVRSAGWVQVMALTAAGLTAAVAAGGFATFTEAAAATGRFLRALVPAPIRVLAGFGTAGAPALRGAGVSVLLLAPFVALFAAADGAFAHALAEIPVTDDVPGRIALALLVLAIVGGLAAVRPAPAPLPPPRGRLGRTEWTIALSALVALFAAFVLLQVTTLFAGHDHVIETAGLTYAEYAREGFGQLVAAAALTLAVIAGARRWTDRTGSERLQRVLLGALCVLTLVILVSAWKRLSLYVEAFGTTRLRMLAQAEILVLGAMFAAVMIGRRVPQASVAIVTAGVLAFALSNPDGRIASTNVERGGRLDVTYLRELSDDAVPAAPQHLCDRTIAGASLISLNVGRSRARAACH